MPLFAISIELKRTIIYEGGIVVEAKDLTSALEFAKMSDLWTTDWTSYKSSINPDSEEDHSFIESKVKGGRIIKILQDVPEQYVDDSEFYNGEGMLKDHFPDEEFWKG